MSTDHATENHGVPGSSPGPATPFCGDSQEKLIEAEEPRLQTEAVYTDFFTNALGQQHVQPIYGFSLHVWQHVRVEIEGRVDSGVPEYLLNYLRVFATGEHERGEAIAQGVEWDVR